MAPFVTVQYALLIGGDGDGGGGGNGSGGGDQAVYAHTMTF